MKLLGKKIVIFILLIAYRILLDLQYVDIVSYLYIYDGYIVDIQRYKVFLSWIPTVLLSWQLISLCRRVSASSLFLLVLGLLYFIPGFSLYAMHGLPDDYFAYYCFSCLLLYLFNQIVPFFYFKQPSLKMQQSVFRVAVWVVVIGTIGILGVYNNFQLKVSFDDIYELRSIQTEMTLPTIVQYFLPMSAMLVPVFMIYFLERKKWIYVAIMIVVQLMSFAFGGLKATFFAAIVALCGVFYPVHKRYLIVLGLTVFSFLGVLEFYSLETTTLTEVITRRVSFIPNKLGYFYYDFFSQHELLYWRGSIFRWFGFDNPYHRYIPWLIGESYFDRRMGCNTGMFGEAFSQFGWHSSYIYALLYVYAFRFMDACAKGVNEKILLVTVALLSISFIDGAFWEVMLTEGFLATAIMLLFMPKNEVQYR